MFKRVIVLFFLACSLLIAAGESQGSDNPRYIIEDFDSQDDQHLEFGQNFLENKGDTISSLNVSTDKSTGVGLVVDLYTKSLDPVASNVEQMLLRLKEDGLINKIKYHYVFEKKWNKPKTDGGKKELQETMIRLVLAKYFPLSLDEYLGYRNINDDDSEGALVLAGVTPSIVLDLVDKQGKQLLLDHARLVWQKDVKKYPVIFVNNRLVESNNLNSVLIALGQDSVEYDLSKETVFMSYELNEKVLGKCFAKNPKIKLTKEETLKLADKYEISRLPFMFIKDNDSLFEASMLKHGFLKKDAVYIKEGVGNVIYLRKYKKVTGKLDVFVRSASLASQEALARLGAYHERVSINVHYLMSCNEKGVFGVNKFISKGGVKETAENIRQLCLYKYYPEKFWQYLELRYQQPEVSWQDTLQQVGIKHDIISGYATSEIGEKLAQENLFMVNQLKVTSEPLFLWQNQQLFKGLNTLRSISEFSDMAASSEAEFCEECQKNG